MRRLELPKLMHVEPWDQRRMYIPARDLMAAAWHRAYAAKPIPPRRLKFPKKEVA